MISSWRHEYESEEQRRQTELFKRLVIELVILAIVFVAIGNGVRAVYRKVISDVAVSVKKADS